MPRLGRTPIHGAYKTPLYAVWINMRARCRYKSADRRGDYMARGITVCDEWQQSFITFRDWALSHGYDPTLTIDRIDNNQGYCPENCRWITALEQGANKRNNVWVEAWGESKTVSQWARDDRAAVAMQTIWSRIRRGMPPEEAIAHPPRR